MKKAFMSLALLLAFWLAGGFSASAENREPYKGARIFWDTTTRKTVFSSGGYSRIIQLQDGRLMACCEHGGIDIAFSSNSGGSWSSATKIVSNPGGINESVPDLIQLSDGTIIVAYNPRPTEPYSQDRRFGIRLKYSTDNGKTWSNEVFVNDASWTFSDGCWEPSMLELPSGEVQLYFADEGPYTNSGEQQISMCRSFDKGKTWTKAQKVGFRAGTRDGMPVPILLQDQSEIVYIFEDNGWGYGDFFPTTARCSLKTNWNNYWVDANSSNRLKALDLSFCPVATGGAPYLRQLPQGYTVCSWQSKYNNNNVITMLTAVGDEKAKNFKAMTHPFANTGSTQLLWNSLAVVDTCIVAVAGVGGSIEMIKGYPKTQFECAYGTPTIDGKSTKNEGYYNSSNSQIRLGSELGIPVLADFAYDAENLYFIARVSDRNQIETGSYADYIRLFVDVAGACDTKPQKTSFQYYMRLSGTLNRFEGTGSSWKRADNDKPTYVVNRASSYYIMEIAIPWTDMGLSGAPAGDLRVNMEIRNGSTDGADTETIPDAGINTTWTWMPLHLSPMPADAGIGGVNAEEDNTLVISASDNTFNVHSAATMQNITVYAPDGRVAGIYKDCENSFSTESPISGMAIIKVELEDGRVISRKVIL